MERKLFTSLKRHLWLWVLFKILIFKIRKFFQYKFTLHEALSWHIFERGVKVKRNFWRRNLRWRKRESQVCLTIQFLMVTCQSKCIKKETPNIYSGSLSLATPGKKPSWSWLCSPFWPLPTTMCFSLTQYISTAMENNLSD